jgi:hypothetical protein
LHPVSPQRERDAGFDERQAAACRQSPKSSSWRLGTLLLCAVVAVAATFGLQRWYLPDLRAAESGADLPGPIEAVATLHRLYPVFTDPARRQGMTLEQRRAVEAEFQELLQLVPMDLLLPQMEKYSVAYPVQLRSFDDPRGFVRRLSEVAMNGIITPRTAEPPLHGDVVFRRDATQPDALTVFTGADKTIFAVFDSSAYDDTRVLVKWYNQRTGGIVLFRQFEIGAGDNNYIWIDNDNGYQDGLYRVEIYRVNETLALLSSGEYQVGE